jgi:site-specific recombinase XerD
MKPCGVTVHSLRKTYAHTLKSASVDVTGASRLMGYSNTSITLSIYTKVKNDEIEKSGFALSDCIGMAS